MLGNTSVVRVATYERDKEIKEREKSDCTPQLFDESTAGTLLQLVAALNPMLF